MQALSLPNGTVGLSARHPTRVSHLVLLGGGGLVPTVPGSSDCSYARRSHGRPSA
jgi:hypothetical protein